MSMNDLRAGMAVEAFMAATGTDPEDAVADLLADLMHYCGAHGMNFTTGLARAEMRYEAEVEEDE